jgi:hypothetical protein
VSHRQSIVEAELLGIELARALAPAYRARSERCNNILDAYDALEGVAVPEAAAEVLNRIARCAARHRVGSLSWVLQVGMACGAELSVLGREMDRHGT